MGILSLILAQVLPDRQLGYAGMVYFLTGPVAMAAGMWAGSRRKKIQESLKEVA